MSYARFGPSSGVYVYVDIAGYFSCCACRLRDTDDYGNFTCRTTGEIVAHLHEHIDAGHAVPAYTIPSLEDDREENDRWIADEGPERRREASR